MKVSRLILILLITSFFALAPLACKPQERAGRFYKKGLEYMEQENFDKALKSFNKAIKLDAQGNPDAYFYRAKIYESKGKSDDAVIDYLKSCEMGSVHCAEVMPDKPVDLQKILEGKWEIGDFVDHVDYQGKSAYGPVNVVDGLPETAWVTKDDPSSILGDMMIVFKPLADATVSGFTIRSGYCKNKDIWEKNSRIKRMMVIIDNKPVVTVTLSDTMDEQKFSFGGDYSLKVGDVISFFILETYPGTKYDEIAISELHLDYDIEGFNLTKKFDTGDKIIGAPAVADGVVYIAGGSGILYAVDISINKQLWEFDSKSSILTSPCVAEGVVYFGNSDGNLYALDVKKGRELWRFGMEGEERISFSPSVIDDVVYFVGGDPWKYGVIKKDNLYALDKKKGQELWRFKTEGQIDIPPSVVDGTVYFESGKDFYAVDKNTGQELLCFKTENWVGPPCLTDGVVYFGNYDGKFYAVDTKTGQELWRFKTEGRIRTSPCVADGAVYFGSDTDGIFYAVDAKTGQELWRFETKDYRCYSPSVVDDVVYFVSGTADTWWNDNLHALDAKSGQELWRIHSPSSEHYIIDGVFYLAGEFGEIYALDLSTRNELWKFQTEIEFCSNPAVVDGVFYIGCDGGCLYEVK